MVTPWEAGGAEKQRTCRARRPGRKTRRRRLLRRWAGVRGARTRCGVATAAATAEPSVPKPVAVGQRLTPHGAACASAAGSGRSEIAPLERTVRPSAP